MNVENSDTKFTHQNNNDTSEDPSYTLDKSDNFISSNKEIIDDGSFDNSDQIQRFLKTLKGDKDHQPDYEDNSIKDRSNDISKSSLDNTPEKIEFENTDDNENMTLEMIQEETEHDTTKIKDADYDTAKARETDQNTSKQKESEIMLPELLPSIPHERSSKLQDKLIQPQDRFSESKSKLAQLKERHAQDANFAHSPDRQRATSHLIKQNKMLQDGGGQSVDTISKRKSYTRNRAQELEKRKEHLMKKILKSAYSTQSSFKDNLMESLDLNKSKSSLLIAFRRTAGAGSNGNRRPHHH